MRITILCNNVAHPVNRWLEGWVAKNKSSHEVELIRDKDLAAGGDLLFLISCSQIVGSRIREQYDSTLIVHAADLPKGRGWSPHIWQIIDGANEITLSLLEAEDQIDSGRIWKKLTVPIKSTWLYDEINQALFDTELSLMDYALEHFTTVQPMEQHTDVEPTFFPKRRPEDSRIDPDKPLSEQFDLLRVSDPERYPAFFEYRGQRYRLTIDKI